MSLGNAGIVYGTRGEVFEGKRDGTLKEFISSTFNIDNVFETKLVMGRCICHGKKALETDILLDNEEEANKFISSRESKKPHVILIYDKHGHPTLIEKEHETNSNERNVVISREQWDELVTSLKKVEITMKEKERREESEPKVVHSYVVCDGCYPTEQADATEICGTRYKCLSCRNFDLCSTCERNGFENFRHKKTHNMIKVKSATGNGLLSTVGQEPVESTTKIMSTDKEVVIDISGDRKDLFEMFSKLENLDDIVHGYEMYKKWTKSFDDEKIDDILKNVVAGQAARSDHSQKPRTRQTSSAVKPGGLIVVMAKKDNAIIFQIHNEESEIIPGGLTLVYSTVKDDTQESGSNVSCELPMGPHELLPGYNKVLKFNYFGILSDISMAARSKVTLIDEHRNIKYEGTNSDGAGSRFVLKRTDALPVPLKDSQDLVLVRDTEISPLLDKNDSDGVISSTITNDNETSHSISSQETIDWDDYDFLSESDV